MTALEKAARQALEALEEYQNKGAPFMSCDAAITALRQALEQPTVKDCLKVEPKQEQEPYCWKVLGVVSEFTGYYAEEEAKATAKRIGGTCQAYPLYVRPQPLAVERERNFCERCGKRLGGADHIHTCTPPQPAPQAAIEQEPAAKVQVKTTGGNAGLATQIVEIDDPLRERLQPGQLLYTEPPKRQWVGLTEDEMTQVANTAETYTESVKLTEAKLKEKNT